MIHHLARALFVRSETIADTQAHGPLPTQPRQERPRHLVRPLPITPWGRPSDAQAPSKPAPAVIEPSSTRCAPLDTWSSVRISSDPSDARRTVIRGRFAEVCATLDRLVMEQEALA